MPKKKTKAKSLWFYCFPTKKYLKIVANKTEVMLDEKDFYDMVNSTESEQQRNDWLIKNNKIKCLQSSKAKKNKTSKKN